MKQAETWNNVQVVLASASPRRKELLNQIGIQAQICPAVMEEETQETEPDQVVMDLSWQKAALVAETLPANTLVIGADTVVSVDGEILGKPENEEKAFEMLKKIQGRSHEVYTGVTLLLCTGNGAYHGTNFAERTVVTVYEMDDEEIHEYIETKDPMDKAGAYGIQGQFAAYIKGIEGDYTNVVGLPLGRLYQEMKHLLEEENDD